MPPTEIVQGFHARLALHGLDERACNILSETWPAIAPCLPDAIDQILTATEHLPAIAAIVAVHRTLIKNLEISHFQALLGGRIDSSYAELCRETVRKEAAIGLDARMRSTAAGFVFRAAITALALKHRFSSGRLAKRCYVLSQAINFDVSNAMALHREATGEAERARRTAIDESIANFAAAIGTVIEAIKETSVSLTSTATTLKQAADDSLHRMAAASSAS